MSTPVPPSPLPVDLAPRQAADWVVVVPVKGGPQAKTRLRAPHGVDHARLATALALDTLTAAAGAVGPGHVVVVTSDPVIAQEASAMGLVTVDDPAAGLDAAIVSGIAHARAHSPTGLRDRQALAHPIAVLLGDIPSVRAADLVAALAESACHERAFVPDADGVGTVLLSATAGGLLRPRFGGESAAAHGESGAVRLELDLPRLRRDVDDEDSLGAALGLGVGPHTAALLAHLIARDDGPRVAAPTRSA